MKPCPRCGVMLPARLLTDPDFACPRVPAAKHVRPGTVGGFITNSPLTFAAGPPPAPPGFGGGVNVLMNVLTPADAAEQLALARRRMTALALAGQIGRKR